MASQSASQQVLDHLLGSDSSSLNLLGVRQKVDDLYSSLEDMIRALNMIAHPIVWPDVLQKFIVINLQYSNLMHQLRPLLKHAIVHPKLVDTADLAAVLPLQLSTFPIPEIQEAEVGLKADIERALKKGDIGHACEDVAQRLEAHNQAINFLVLSSSAEPDAGVFDANGAAMKSIKAKSREISNQVNELASKRAAALQPQGGTAAGGKRGGAGGRASSAAKRKREAGDDVINMFLTGDGLKGVQGR